MNQLPALFAIKTFILASKYLSFTKTAEMLHMTQGAVSKQVKQLEDMLGATLFVREYHTLKLTVEGRRVLPYFTQALEKIHEGMSTVGDFSQAGTHLCINVAPTFSSRWLVPRLHSFCALHPDINLTIRTDYSPEELVYGHAHCSIRFGTDAAPGAESLLLFREQNVLVGLPAFLAESKNLARFVSTHTLLHILNGERRLDVWEHWVALSGMSAHLDPSGGMEFSTMDQVISAALTGVGIALLDKSMIQKELGAGTLVMLSPVVSHGPYGYWFDNNRMNSPDIAAFKNWLMQAV